MDARYLDPYEVPCFDYESVEGFRCGLARTLKGVNAMIVDRGSELNRRRNRLAVGIIDNQLPILVLELFRDIESNNRRWSRGQVSGYAVVINEMSDVGAGELLQKEICLL